MVDFADMDFSSIYHEPVEVYLAAIGEPEELAKRILENEIFPANERAALAALLRGELQPPKRKRGQKRIQYLTTLEDSRERVMEEAVSDYHRIMRAVREEHGSNHKVKFKAIEYISETTGIDYESLLNRINRPKQVGKKKEDVVEVAREVVNFHKWLHRTKRLPNYPDYVEFVGLAAFLIRMQRQSYVKNKEGS